MAFLELVRGWSRRKSNRRVGFQPVTRRRASLFELQPLEQRMLMTAAPVITGPASINTGVSYALTLAAHSNATVSSWHVNWGDGSSVQTVSGNPGSVSHTFTGVNHYSVSSTVTDTNGTYTSNTAPVNVYPATAAFVGADSSTQGTWSGVYGADGYSMFNVASSIPSYATLSVTGASTGTWGTSTTDARYLQNSLNSSSRTAARDYTTTNFTVNVKITDGASHQIALYMLDRNNSGYSQTVAVSDAISNTVLDSQSVSSFNNGQWLIWTVSGDVNIKFTKVSGNAVVSGIFFDGIPHVYDTWQFDQTTSQAFIGAATTAINMSDSLFGSSNQDSDLKSAITAGQANPGSVYSVALLNLLRGVVNGALETMRAIPA